MQTQRMSGGAIALHSRARGLLLTIQPIEGEELVQMAAFSRDGDENAAEAFSDLAGRFQNIPLVVDNMQSCEDVGMETGPAHFERP